MPRKRLTRLRAQACGGHVRLSCFIGTPFFESSEGRGEQAAIRVYRKPEPDFTFGQDYDEYFDGLDWRDAELIFDGALPAINRRKFEYLDATVAIGATYAYWAAVGEDDQPLGPAPVRIRDPRVWWPQAETERRMAELAQAYPKQLRLVNFGATVKGHPLNGLVAGNPAKTIALVGTVHAGESGPELIVPALERLLRENGALLGKTGVAAIPSVNIDERERLVNGYPPYLRVNAAGVDLNRNFDADWEQTDYGYGLVSSDPDAATYRGAAPASEPETKALVRFVEEVKPKILLSFHALASICGACFLFARSAAQDERFVGECRRLGEAYGKGMYPDRLVEPRVSPGCSAGSLPAWLYRRHRIIGFDLENDGAASAKLSLTDLTTKALVEEYRERHYQGLVALMHAL